MSSIDDVYSTFSNESEKLENLIIDALDKTDFDIPQIIELYYQIMNVNSLSTLLKQQLTIDDNKILPKIKKVEKIISDKFNESLHPIILKKLTNLINKTMDDLQSENSDNKSKDQVKNEANLYEKLRQMMSTKEFVEQYDKGLSHD